MKKVKCLTFKKLVIHVFCIIFALSSLISAQINIPGITGLSFDNSGDDYTISLTSNFNLHGMELEPVGLSLKWIKSDNKFEIFGELKLTIENEVFDLALGSLQYPGLIIQNSELQSVSFGIFSNEFTLKDMTFEVSSFSLDWNKTTNKYLISGDMGISVEDDKIYCSLGLPGSPGITISNGVVEEIEIGIDEGTNFNLKTLAFQSDGLTIKWQKTPDRFIIIGEAFVTIDDDNMDVTFGTEDIPGITIVGGKIEEFNLTINEYFQLKGLDIVSKGLTLKWNRSPENFVIFGDLTIKIDSDSINATLGNESIPGITITNSQVEELNISITSSFELKSISFTTDNETLYWQRSSNEYLLSGSFTIDVESDEISVDLGTREHPGLVILNGEIIRLDMVINADFEMKDLAIDVKNAEIIWQQGYFAFSGEINLNIDGQIIDASLGDRDNPGIIFQDHKITQIRIIINSDLKFGNMEVITNFLELEYNNNIYLVSGDITITDVWTLDVSLGDNSNPGIEVDVSGNQDKFILENLIITLDNANLGAIDFKKIQLKFKDNKLAEADMIASFPPGWEVGGDIKFTDTDPVKVESVSIFWETDNIEEAIEIPGTGMAVVYISGEIDNVYDPSKFEFKGDVGLTFGGPFKVDGHDVAFLYIGTEIDITQKSLYIDSDIDVGAYKSDNVWHSLLGDGSLKIDLIWNEKYTLDGKFKIPTDPMIEATLTAQISSGKSLDALLDVEFIVPHFVPFIHGKHFGSVDGAIRYLDGHPTKSYAAGWVHYSLGWLGHIYVGAKYNFGTKHISKIGHSSIDKIKDEIKDDGKTARFQIQNSPSNECIQIVKYFEIIENPPTMVRVGLAWDSEIDTSLVTVMGPDGIMTLISLNIVDDGDSSSIPTITTSDNLTFVDSETEIDFLIVPPSSLNDDISSRKASLTPGKYQVFFSYYPNGTILDSLNIVAEKYHPQAQGSIVNNGFNGTSFDLKLDYWAYYPDSTLISIYTHNTPDYSGKLVGHIPYGEIQENENGSAVYNYLPNNTNVNDSIYFYFVIDDGINVPFYSDITQPFKYTPPIFGTLTLIGEDITMQNFTVYLDQSGDGKYDTESTGGLEPSCVSNTKGVFEFNGISQGTHNLNIIIPKGYVIDESSPNKFPLIINYDNNSKKVDFTIRKEN